MRSATAVTGARSWSGGDRYQEAAEIALHDETHPPTFAMNLAGRANQYDLWPRFADRASPGDNLVLALDESDPPHPTATALSVYFREMRRGELVTLRRRTGDVGVRRIWILVDWRGQWPRSPGP